MQPTQNLHVKEIVRLLPPRALKDEFPMTERANQTVVEGRETVKRILRGDDPRLLVDRKSTRLNSSHITISYAVYCLKKKSRTTGSVTSSTNQHSPRRNSGSSR